MYAQNAIAFGWLAAYLGLGAAMLGVFTMAYVWITPYDDIADIRAGKMAPAIALVGAMLGFAAPLLIASFHGANIRDYLVWSTAACLVQLLAFKVLYWLLPNQIEANNPAAALVYAGSAVCVGLINAFSMIP